MKEATNPAYHAQGTVVMGPPDDPNSCVGPDFCVYGISSLRVADLSIAPLNLKYVHIHLLLVNQDQRPLVSVLTPLFSNHPQSTAYLIGHKAAEAIMKRQSL